MISFQRHRCKTLAIILIIAIFILNGCARERNIFGLKQIEVSDFIFWEVSQIDPDAMFAYFLKQQTQDENMRISRAKDTDEWVIYYPVLEFGQIAARVSVCIYDEEQHWEKGEGYIAYYDDTFYPNPVSIYPEPALKDAGEDDHFICEFTWYGKRIRIVYDSLLAANYRERMERVLHDLAKCQDYTDAAVN